MDPLKFALLTAAIVLAAGCPDFDSFHVRDGGNKAEAGANDGDTTDDGDTANDGDTDGEIADGGMTDGIVADLDSSSPCSSDQQCSGVQYCAPTGSCVPRNANAADCSAANQCLSGFCDPDGVCCKQGEDCCHNDGECSGEYKCDVGVRECFDTCGTGNETAVCKSTGYCSATTGGHCIPDLAPSAAQACTRDTMCMGNANCIDDFCCNTTCAGCRACNLAGSQGTCALVPATADPHGTCAVNGCVTTGLCNGNGGCAVPTAGTTVSGACTASGCLRDGTCNGTGGCRPAAAGTNPGNTCFGGSTSCQTGVCNGSGACASKGDGVSCGTSNPMICGTPRCQSGTCLFACEYSGNPSCGACSEPGTYDCGC